MLPFKTSISIFWHESDTYVAVYAAFALLACIVISAFEFHHQTSSVPYTRFLLKAVALTGATVVIFTLWLYVTGWQSQLLGGEIITSLVTGAIWYAMLYFVNAALLEALAVSLENPRFYAHLAVVVLLLPCFLAFAYVVALGSSWTI
jgi:hypothetical protein